MHPFISKLIKSHIHAKAHGLTLARELVTHTHNKNQRKYH